MEHGKSARAVAALGGCGKALARAFMGVGEERLEALQDLRAAVFGTVTFLENSRQFNAQRFGIEEGRFG